MRRSYFLLFTVHCLLFAVLLWGCGSLGSDPVTAPPDSTITINPGTMTATCTDDPEVEGDACEVATWHTVFFTIYVQNSDGTPLGKVKITISYPWAVPDSFGAVQLYDGDNKVNSPFDAETDDFGVYYLRFDYLLGGGFTYNGDLEVRSGSAYGIATIDVTSN
jgi:hypothetical protein